ncbi:unnamed protein product [Miscanthus lutarioriparius]|uniref:Uncharacterized protein n=1 Tax=Miscanthus lutarioriparius TaxID=422564 RepID=A0A811QHU8_9POAL|nr:unnamed protein product [Miscanthus lutarioriparius]
MRRPATSCAAVTRGVVFVAASASCALKEVKFSNDLSSAGARTLLHKLAVHYPDHHGCGGGPTDRPLLLMQVTEFTCSGFAWGDLEPRCRRWCWDGPILAGHRVSLPVDCHRLQFFRSANVRKHVVGLKKAYYGNCLTAEIVRAKSGTVARGDIIDLVNLINYSKEKIGDQLFKNNTGSSCRRQEEEEEAAALQVPYDLLTISSWRNLGLDEVDFGSGRPARVASCVAEDQPAQHSSFCTVT